MIRLLGALLCLLVAAPALATEITLWHAYRGAEEEALDAAAEAWTAESGVSVKMVAVPFGAFDSKLETAIPRGNGPDLFIAGHSQLGKWLAMDLVEATPSVDSTGFRPGLVDVLTVDGATYGLPLAVKSIVLLYDPSVVDEPPATTDELLALAREHTGGGRYGLAYQAAEPYFHAAWMHAFGAAAYDPEGGVHLDSPAHIAALRVRAGGWRSTRAFVPTQLTGSNWSLRLYDEWATPPT